VWARVRPKTIIREISSLAEIYRLPRGSSMPKPDPGNGIPDQPGSSSGRRSVDRESFSISPRMMDWVLTA